MFGILAPRSYQPRRNAQGWFDHRNLADAGKGNSDVAVHGEHLVGQAEVDGHVCTVNGDTHLTGSQSSGYQTADQAQHTHTAATTISILTRRFVISRGGRQGTDQHQSRI